MQIHAVFSEPLKVHRALLPQRSLGKGKFTVYHIKTTPSQYGNEFAMKVFPRRDGQPRPSFRREKRFLSKVKHPHIIRYIPILKHDFPHDLLLTEYSPNGDFFEFVSQGGMCNEKIMRTFFHQLIEGLEYLHSQGITHLDLKLENLLVDGNFDLKIFDFDHAQSTEDKKLYSAGTLGYRAPEVIKKKCKDLKKADMYAIGVLLYTFKTGEMPFVEGKSKKVRKTLMYEMFQNENETFWQEKEKELGIMFSKDLRDLLNGLLEENVEKRFNIEDVKKNRWYNQEVYTQEELKKEVQKIVQRYK